MTAYANNDDQLSQVIAEALTGDRWAESYLRQRFKIPPHTSISQWLDEIVAGEPNDPFARSQR